MIPLPLAQKLHTPFHSLCTCSMTHAHQFPKFNFAKIKIQRPLKILQFAKVHVILTPQKSPTITVFPEVHVFSIIHLAMPFSGGFFQVAPNEKNLLEYTGPQCVSVRQWRDQ